MVDWLQRHLSMMYNASMKIMDEYQVELSGS